MRLKDNPSACVEPEYRNGRTCRECYFSQTNEKNQWTGSQRCWNAGCIVADMSEQSIAATVGTSTDLANQLREVTGLRSFAELFGFSWTDESDWDWHDVACAMADAIDATAGTTMTLDEATEYAERFMGDYAKVLLESTLYVERDEPTNQHAFGVAEQREEQMTRDLAEALANAGAGTCKLVDNDSGPDMHCTACGGGVDDEYRYFMDSWGYSRCPHCGARIIEEVAE